MTAGQPAAGPGLSPAAAPEGPEPGDRVIPDGLVRELTDHAAAEQSAGRLPTLAVGLAGAGRLFWFLGLGRGGVVPAGDVTPETQYRIGSISKTFTAVTVMRLRDEGALDLSDPIGRHLGELDLPVNIAQLLSHTAGLPAEPAGPWWERTPGVDFAVLAQRCLHESALLWRPGRRFHYSNLGYALLGELVARKRGAPFPAVLAEELLEPLGMHHTTMRPVTPHARGFAVHPHADLVLDEPEHDAVSMAPAGQLWSTATDLARWSAVLAGERPAILAPASAAEMSEPLSVEDRPGQSWSAAYGLGLQLWAEAGRRCYGHSGSMPGFVSLLVADQASGTWLVALCNSTAGFRPTFRDQMLGLAARARSVVPEFPPAGDRPDPSLLELCGTWYWGPRPYSLSLGPGGVLRLRGVPSGRDCDFRPVGGGAYVGEWGYFAGERLEPRRRAPGAAVQLEVATFVFTRAPYDPEADIPGGLDERSWRPL